MTPARFEAIAVRPAMTLLPPAMNTAAARAFIVAICLQESRLTARRQMGGPARGYAQFEIAGVAGVLSHRASRPHATRLCEELDIVPAATAVYAALEHHDVLTCGFARLLLATLPESLPARGAYHEAWRQYLSAWRPGKPHRDTWDACFNRGWATVTASEFSVTGDRA